MDLYSELMFEARTFLVQQILNSFHGTIIRNIIKYF